MENLENKVAVVTGAASGMGLAFAHRFARATRLEDARRRFALRQDVDQRLAKHRMVIHEQHAERVR